MEILKPVNKNLEIIKFYGRDIRKNFEKGFPLQLSDCCIRIGIFPDCFIRVSRSFHQNRNSEQRYKCCYHVRNYLTKIKVLNVSCSMTDSKPEVSISSCFKYCVKTKGFPETPGNPPPYTPVWNPYGKLHNK